MIHAYALEPKLVATWGSRAEARFIVDKFGLGAPRVLLELPQFAKWRTAVLRAANELGVEGDDAKRLVELLKMFAEHRCLRADATYDELKSWLENAEHEWKRREFAAIVATENPRGHKAVLLSEQLDANNPRWKCATGASPQRTPKAMADALRAMLSHSRQLHLVDPYFAPAEERFKSVLLALVDVLDDSRRVLDVIRIHCGDKNAGVRVGLADFEADAQALASHLPAGVTIEFVRWSQRWQGDDFHNRYVLTDIGGTSFGIGLDAGKTGETDDVSLLTRDQYLLRWRQYVDETEFHCVDRPASVVGTGRPRKR